MTNSQITRILSPLLFFVIHVLYLLFVSRESFFDKWVSGSFTFFLALVMCNIIRARIVAAAGAAEESDPDDPAKGESNPGDPGAP